jgi:transcriptional regulator of aromatic amino acid metabolism
MLVMNSPDTVTFSEMALLRLLSSRDHRPNLMIVNETATLEDVLHRLTGVVEAPVWFCQFPGSLDLQPNISGTLVLGDIDRMTIDQQIRLSDWLWRRGLDVQVVSVTRASMTELVADGRFLEGLFYRLNTVVIRAISGSDYGASL